MARSRVFSADEIGGLAVDINHMASSLEQYHREVQEKERARTSLLKKIVDTQEEERKVISRELHDQLGQTLSSTLLDLKNLSDRSKLSEDMFHPLEKPC